MGKNPKIKKPHETQSVIKEFATSQLSKTVNGEEECFVVSLKHLYRPHRDRLYEWQEKKLLAGAIDLLANYCALPLHKQFDDKFTLYGVFPKNSAYQHPPYIAPDANWARIHINGTHIIAGHVHKNTFYIVFLDENHTFYITKGADN